jgi:hypothetical protein
MKQVVEENGDAMIDALNMFTPHAGTELFDESVKLGFRGPRHVGELQGYLFRGKNRAAWLSRADRAFIENACDTSIYTGNVGRVFDSDKNPLFRILLTALMYLPEKYFKRKWKHNRFGFDPVFPLLRMVRKITRIEV